MPRDCDPWANAASQRLSRRSLLGRGGAAATVAAAQSLAPFLFSGCDIDLPSAARTIRVGLLHSQTGTMAISSSPLRDIELFAFEEINAAGGVMGRPVEVVAPDPRSRTELFPKRARDLIEKDKVVVVFGCHTSASRKAAIPVFEELDKLLFYPVEYEGNEASKNVIYGGSLPNQQILPAIDWLFRGEGGGKSKIFLLGSDYVFPRTANLIARKHLEAKGLAPVGELYMPLGSRDFEGVIEQLIASGADCVLNTINGDSNIAFFEALEKTKIDGKSLPVVSTSVGETELRSLLPAQVRGHLAAAGYYQSLDTAANRDWVKRFQSAFGQDRVTSDGMESAYCLVNLWKLAVEKAGTFNAEAIRTALGDGIEFSGPGGAVRVDPKTLHCSKRFRLGQIRGDRQFDIVYESPDPILPDPYPQIAFPGWSVDWTRGGVTRGAEVPVGS